MNSSGEFIKINEKGKKYYHIYFNDNKDEIKRNYLNKDDKVNKIKIIAENKIRSFSKLLYDCKCIESIYFKRFYMKHITDMNYMFYECSSLKELNLTNFHSNNVTNMCDMFNGCSLLKELNINNLILIM